MPPSAPPGSRYPHHHLQHSYERQLPPFSSNPSTHDTSRLPPSYSFPNITSTATRPLPSPISRQLPPLPNMPPSNSTSALSASSRRRDRHPDWEDFYKNGVPKEIIVIEDDTPPPTTKKGRTKLEPLTPQDANGARNAQHASKKRRIGQNTYDSARDDHTAYSHGRTYSQADKSNSDTISTDRTTSLHTTAPTSLSSHGSAGAQYADDMAVGQKRKRVTRQQIADEKRRKEIDILGDPNSTYVPPPKPPIKAKDVNVPAIRDVSSG